MNKYEEEIKNAELPKVFLQSMLMSFGIIECAYLIVILISHDNIFLNNTFGDVIGGFLISGLIIAFLVNLGVVGGVYLFYRVLGWYAEYQNSEE